MRARSRHVTDVFEFIIGVRPALLIYNLLYDRRDRGCFTFFMLLNDCFRQNSGIRDLKIRSKFQVY